MTGIRAGSQKVCHSYPSDRTQLTWFVQGTGNKLVQSIASNANLAKVARDIGLDKYIVLHPGQASSAPTERTLATALEAVLGAIDYDSGESAGAVRTAMGMIGLIAEAFELMSSARQ